MDQALQTMIDNMPEKTGKSLAEWKEILGNQAIAKHSQAVAYLKKEHGLTHGYANTIVALHKQGDQPSTNLVAAQYKGKEPLKPIYEALLTFAKSLGSDVQVKPKKTSVSLVRNRQFILIKPATKTRIDLGFKLPGKPVGERLEDSGPFGTMCTHRVRLTAVEQVDKELKDWIREAYQTAG